MRSGRESPGESGYRLLAILPAIACWPFFRLSPEELATQPHDGVVLLVCDALLHGDQRVVGDLDVLWAHLGAALGDVAQAEAVLFLGHVTTVKRVQRVHRQLGLAHQVPR